MFRLLQVVVSILGTIFLVSLMLNNWNFQFDLGGNYYVGKGKVEIEFKLGGQATGNLNQTVMKWDAVRLNERSSGSDDWYLDFNELPIKLDRKPILLATMYITIKLHAPPKRGTFKSAFWSGPEAYIELWSPTRSSREPNGKRLNGFSVKHVQILFDEVELKKGGKVIGEFRLKQKENVVKGKFDLVLGDAPPLFSAWN